MKTNSGIALLQKVEPDFYISIGVKDDDTVVEINWEELSATVGEGYKIEENVRDILKNALRMINKSIKLKQ